MKVLFEHGNFALLFEPRDLWIGVFWDKEKYFHSEPHKFERLVIYVCTIPMLPIRYTSPYWIKTNPYWFKTKGEK
jgi:hypothetical protein